MKKLLSKVISDLGKCPKKKMHDRESAGFLVWALTVVKIPFKIVFFIKWYILTVLKTNAFWLI